MTEVVPASGTVHWIGAGLSTGSGLAALCDSDADGVRLWHRTEERAADALGRAGPHRPRRAPRVHPARARGRTRARGRGRLDAPGARTRPAAGGLRTGRGRTSRAPAMCRSAVLEQVPAAEAAGRRPHRGGPRPGYRPPLRPQPGRPRRARPSAPAHRPRTASPPTAEASPPCPTTSGTGSAGPPPGSSTPCARPPVTSRTAPRRSPTGPGRSRARTSSTARPSRSTRTGTACRSSASTNCRRPGRPRTFVRGTLRLDGWLSAWDSVFDGARTAATTQRIAALARELAARYPTTDADRDRVVLAVSLDVTRRFGRRTWSGAIPPRPGG